MSWYKISGHWLEISGRRLEISGRQKQSSPGGSDGKCWAEMSLQLRIGAQITWKYARNLFIDVYTINFIACNTKKCFWLQFNRPEPCWSSGCVRNRQGSGTKYRLSRCKHCIKMLPTSGRFRHIPGPVLLKIWATQKSELVKYLKTTFRPHERRLNAHNLRYQKQDRFWIGWFRILTTQLLKLTAQPVNCAK